MVLKNYNKYLLILCQVIFSGQNFAMNAMLLVFLSSSSFAMFSNLIHLCGIISSFFATLIINYHYNQKIEPDSASWIGIHRISIAFTPVLALMIITISKSAVSSLGLIAYSFALLIILRDLYCRIQQMSDYFVSTIIMVMVQLGILSSIFLFSSLNSEMILILSLSPFLLGSLVMSSRSGRGEKVRHFDVKLLLENGKISGLNSLRSLLLISFLSIFLSNTDFEFFYLTRLIFSPLLFMVPIFSVYILKYANMNELDVYFKLISKWAFALSIVSLAFIFSVSHFDLNYLNFGKIQLARIPFNLVIYWVIYFCVLVIRSLLETFLIKGGDTRIRIANSYVGLVATVMSLFVFWALDGSRFLPYYWILVFVELLLVIMIFTKMHRKGI